MAIRIGRREFIITLGGAVVAQPLPARSQQATGVRRIGMLMASAESDRQGQTTFVAAFREELQKQVVAAFVQARVFGRVS